MFCNVNFSNLENFLQKKPPKAGRNRECICIFRASGGTNKIFVGVYLMDLLVFPICIYIYIYTYICMYIYYMIYFTYNIYIYICIYIYIYVIKNTLTSKETIDDPDRSQKK